MRIAILQFSPQLGKFAANAARADALLEKAALEEVDFLVLPELALTGYNFDSFEHIAPHLEVTAAGPSTEWARRTARKYHCAISIGYPERAAAGPAALPGANGAGPNYNSTVTISSDGDRVLAHYRKTHLYFTDETWATESPTGWLTTSIPLPSSSSPVVHPHGTMETVFGICMDLNPHRFTAPWERYEFATHVVRTGAELVCCSMAWLAKALAEESPAQAQEPDWETLSYWLSRFRPVTQYVAEKPAYRSNCARQTGNVIIVIANRCGQEKGVKYAGTSCVIRMTAGNDIGILGMLGRAQEGVLIVDTALEPHWTVKGDIDP